MCKLPSLPKLLVLDVERLFLGKEGVNLSDFALFLTPACFSGVSRREVGVAGVSGGLLGEEVTEVLGVLVTD